jgi:hypothetical protein
MSGETKSESFIPGAILIRKDVRNAWKLVLDTKAVDPLYFNSTSDILTRGNIITTDMGVYSNKDDALKAGEKFIEGQTVTNIGEGEDNIWTYEFITYKEKVIQLIWSRVRIVRDN